MAALHVGPDALDRPPKEISAKLEEKNRRLPREDSPERDDSLYDRLPSWICYSELSHETWLYNRRIVFISIIIVRSHKRLSH